MAAMETGSMITMAIGRTADERRAIAEFLTGKSLSNPVVLAPAPAAMCPAATACIRFERRAALDRLGTEHQQHTFPGCGSGRPDCRGHSEAETQMGLRLPRRSPVLLAGQHRWRTHLRRQLGRHGVLAQRRDRMHSLVLRHRTAACDRRSSVVRVDMPGGARDVAVLRRCGCQRLRTGRGDRQAAVEDRRGRLSRRAHQRLADVSQRTHLRRCRIGRRSRRRRAHLRVLQVPRQRRRARRGHRQTDLEELHDSGAAEADEEERRRHATLWTIRRAGVGDAGCRRQAESRSTSPPATTTATRRRR